MTYKILHDVTATPQTQAEQNFYKGQVSKIEDMLGLVEELAKWQKTLREGRRK